MSDQNALRLHLWDLMRARNWDIKSLYARCIELSPSTAPSLSSLYNALGADTRNGHKPRKSVNRVGWRMLRAIAIALDTSVDALLALGGLTNDLSPADGLRDAAPTTDEMTTEICEILNDLTPEGRDRMLDMLRSYHMAHMHDKHLRAVRPVYLAQGVS